MNRFLRSMVPFDPLRRFRDVAYLRLSRDRMELQIFRGRPFKEVFTVSSTPVAAVERRGDRARILGLGDAEIERYRFRYSHVETIRLFEHPRILLAKTEIFDVIGYFLRRHVRRWPLRPIMLMQQIDSCSGGLAIIEKRALHEIGSQSLGGTVLICEATEILTACQIHSIIDRL